MDVKRLPLETRIEPRRHHVGGLTVFHSLLLTTLATGPLAGESACAFGASGTLTAAAPIAQMNWPLPVRARAAQQPTTFRPTPDAASAPTPITGTSAFAFAVTGTLDGLTVPFAKVDWPLPVTRLRAAQQPTIYRPAPGASAPVAGSITGTTTFVFSPAGALSDGTPIARLPILAGSLLENPPRPRPRQQPALRPNLLLSTLSARLVAFADTENSLLRRRPGFEQSPINLVLRHAPGAGGGALTGTAGFAFAPAAALTGSGALAGSSGLAFTPIGTLTNESSALTGAASWSFVAAGALTGEGALAGTVTGFRFTLSGSLDQLDPAPPERTIGAAAQSRIVFTGNDSRVVQASPRARLIHSED